MPLAEMGVSVERQQALAAAEDKRYRDRTEGERRLVLVKSLANKLGVPQKFRGMFNNELVLYTLRSASRSIDGPMNVKLEIFTLPRNVEEQAASAKHDGRDITVFNHEGTQIAWAKRETVNVQEGQDSHLITRFN